MAVNVTGTIILTKYISRAMMVNNEGRIVNVSSIVADTGFTGLSVYSATKSAMIGFSRSLARELGRCNITVNAIAPGFLKTEMSSEITTEQLERISRRSALGRLTDVDDVSIAVAYLLSDAARSVTGITLTIDSGATA
jgi:3-oxoacyl-[acyl-carrier protein] reductase